MVVNDLGGATDGLLGRAGRADGQGDRGPGRGHVADTSTVATVEGGQAIVDALDAFGRVDVVIGNAGILRDKAFHNLTPELLDPDVHLKGAFHVLGRGPG